MSKVIVVLDRMAADYLRLVGNDHHSGEYFSDCYQNEVMPAVEAALGRDPDALIEQVARAISDANDLDGWGWDRDTINGKLAREQYRKLARAALAAITGEGKDR